MAEKISVIVPIYKVEKYIRRCIDSIINQTYKDLEIILVDDGSPDNCPKIIEEYAKLDSRIKVIHKENGGLSSARNAGMKIATGDYLAFVDSDDTIDIKMYEVLYDVLKRNNADISVCDILRIHENDKGEVIYPEVQQNPVRETEFERAEMIKQMLVNGNIGNFACTKLFKKELFGGITFPDGKVYEDVATIYKVVHKANKIVYVNKVLYYYLFGRVGAITSSFSEKKILDSLEAYHTQYEFLSKNYKEIAPYVNVTWVKMFTSAMEKICMNDYNDLLKSQEVLTRYESFKHATDMLDKDVLYKYLEPYRLISAILVRHDIETYKLMFKTIYENVKNK